VIDGLSQPGASNTSWPPTLQIVMDGASAPGSCLTLNSSNSTVRGLVIKNYGGAVGISLSSSDCIIECNFIGTDVTGTFSQPNGRGISAGGSRNLIGGAAVAARNLISGNRLDGIFIGGSDHLVQSNFIGTDVTGTAALGNGDHGIFISGGANNTIGGTSAAARNLISGNGNEGILIPGAGSNNFVQGNYIGTDVSGIAAISNANRGVIIQSNASQNTIGGIEAGAGNLIAYNSIGGVHVSNNGVGNAILGNSIFSNQGGSFGLGIDLIGNSGITANDPGDGDTGPNNLQNFPVLSAAVSYPTSTVINGSLNSTANTSFTIEFFSNLDCDPLGNGEGEELIGRATVTTDGSGDVSFSQNRHQFPIRPRRRSYLVAQRRER